MIKNERQYKITKSWLSKFKVSLKQVLNSEAKGDLLVMVEANAIKSQIDEFKRDIAQYDRLKRRVRTPIKSVYRIGDMLVMARIMNGFTQKKLAALMKMKEQQIQRYEETEYQNASLSTVFAIATALNISTSTFDMSIKTKSKQ